jgi:hypothetical protein
MYNTTNTITCMEGSTSSWIIFNCTMIVTMFNILVRKKIEKIEKI